MRQKVPSSPTMAEHSFEDLLVSVGKQRDRSAFITLFNHFAPRLKSYLVKQGSDESQAEELVQSVMLTVWQKAKSYDPKKAAASTWIFTIARNRRIDAIRKEGRPEADPNDPALHFNAPDAPDDVLIHADTSETLNETIKKLPREQSDLIYKSYFEDKSHSEIARETGLPLGTVKSRLRLALTALRKTLHKEEFA